VEAKAPKQVVREDKFQYQDWIKKMETENQSKNWGISGQMGSGLLGMASLDSTSGVYIPATYTNAANIKY
jgi:hypothetical protein